MVFMCFKPDQGMNIFCIDSEHESKYSKNYNTRNMSLVQFSIANTDDYVLPTFHTLHNLTHLRLQNVSDGWNVDLLNAFLEYSPNLEVLVLEVCSNSITGFQPHCSPFVNFYTHFANREVDGYAQVVDFGVHLREFLVVCY